MIIIDDPVETKIEEERKKNIKQGNEIRAAFVKALGDVFIERRDALMIENLSKISDSLVESAKMCEVNVVISKPKRYDSWGQSEKDLYDAKEVMLKQKAKQLKKEMQATLEEMIYDLLSNVSPD